MSFSKLMDTLAVINQFVDQTAVKFGRFLEDLGLYFFGIRRRYPQRLIRDNRQRDQVLAGMGSSEPTRPS